MVTSACAEPPPDVVSRRTLADGWSLQSSAEIEAGGAELSSPGYDTAGWHRATVPTTVVAALVDAGVVPDPYFGMNLRELPGADYPIGRIFSKLEMPEGSPFRASWWYRTEFELPAAGEGGRVALHFDGINYRAEIWLNGERLAGQGEVAGAYRRYEFDVTRLVRRDGRNALAVEVFPPGVDDLALTWVDWNPMAPDKAMGLWRDVVLTTSGPVTLRHPHVVSELDLPSLSVARLRLAVDVHNRSAEALAGRLRGHVAGVALSRRLELAAGESRTVRFSPEDHPALAVRQPKLWWPHAMGEPALHDAELVFELGEGARVSDSLAWRFGIRQVTSELTEEGHRLFRVNGRRLLIRGAGWAPDMLARFSPERAESELRYVRDLGLGAVRLEGTLEPEPFFELADRYGILLMAGWVCCSHWERWPKWTHEDHAIAAASLRDQVRRLRQHPSVFVWLNGSDGPPPANVEKAYLKVLDELDWPNPVLSSATAKDAEHSGASGVKMNGPYEWIPPSYWLRDSTQGGAFGFATEVGPGPVVPPLASLREMLPESSLWPIDEQWLFHAGSGRFGTLELFNQALAARYGKPEGVEDYAFKAQLLGYEGLRAMFEAYGRNKYRATGVIQWMLNDAWPSLTWHLYDHYLRPGGAYFGAKRALEPVHVQYSYDDRSVVVVNSRYEDLPGLRVVVRATDLELRELFADACRVDVPADGVSRVVTLPDDADWPSTYLLRLELSSATGEPLSSNLYWLSTRTTELDWRAATWYHTPVTAHADLTALADLPEVALEHAVTFERDVTSEHGGDDGVATVTVTNPTPHLAFAVRLRLLRGQGGREILPILWDDNYFALFPGESRRIVARYRWKDLAGAEPVVAVDGWNVKP